MSETHEIKASVKQKTFHEIIGERLKDKSISPFEILRVDPVQRDKIIARWEARRPKTFLERLSSLIRWK